MPAWVTITAAEVESALQAPELAALREAALGDNSPDPITNAISDVIARVRGYAGSRVGNYLDRDQTLIPPELHQDGIWLVIQTLKLRLGVATPLSEDQRDRVRTAEQDLKDVALGRFRISKPLSPESPSSLQSSGGAEVLPSRPRNFGGGCGGSYMPRKSSGKTLGEAGIVDGVSNTAHYFDPSWLTGLAWSKIIARPTTVADSDLTDAVSTTALSAALAAMLVSPAFTGTPTVPTAAQGTNTTQAASTAFVRGEVAGLLGSAPAALDTLNELAAALGNDPSFATTVTNALALKAPLASPAFTGTPTVPTATAGTNTTQVASTAFVRGELANLVASAPAALDTLNELAAALGNDANFATTVTNALALKAPLASPTFTGTPAGPTAAVDTSTTQLATTAFVINQAYLKAATALATYAPIASPSFTGTVGMASASVFGWNGDALMVRDAANWISQRNGVNAQGHSIYNTYTSSTSYERFSAYWSGNALYLATEKGSGGGSQRQILFDASAFQWLLAGSSSNGLQLGGGNLNPLTNAGVSLGTTANRFSNLCTNKIDTTGTVNVTSTSASGWSMFAFTDNSNAQKFYVGFGNPSAGSFPGVAFLQTNGVDVAVANGAAEILRFNSGGGILTPKTIVASGNTGAQTINKMAGSVNFAAGATSLVVTNSLATTNSVIVCQLVGTDATAALGGITKASGSFTINMKTAPTAETRVDFYIATT